MSTSGIQQYEVVSSCKQQVSHSGPASQQKQDISFTNTNQRTIFTGTGYVY